MANLLVAETDHFLLEIAQSATIGFRKTRKKKRRKYFCACVCVSVCVCVCVCVFIMEKCVRVYKMQNNLNNGGL